MSDHDEARKVAEELGLVDPMWTEPDPRHMAILLAFAKRVRAERDWEWWEAVGGVDNVAPTPEACKQWQIALEELVAEQATEPLRAQLSEAQQRLEKELAVSDAAYLWLAQLRDLALRATSAAAKGRPPAEALALDYATLVDPQEPK